jgi:hypothetical protein
LRKFYPYATALALMLGGAIYGSAQTQYSGQEINGFGRQLYQTVVANAFLDERDHHWEEGRRRAQEAGREDGFRDGRSDREHRREFQPRRGGSYKHGDRGYDGRYGDKRRYVEAYREAYSHGYEEGYHGGGREPGHGHEPGTH